MRIVFLTELFYPHIGGTEKRFFEIGRRLVSRGHDVRVLTVGYNRSLLREETIEGMDVCRCAYSDPYLNPRYYRSLTGILKFSTSAISKLLRNEDYDVIYMNQWPVLPSFLSTLLPDSFVQEWCEVWPGKMGLIQRLQGKFTQNHVAVSKFTERRMVDQLKIEPVSITTIPNGVDYDRYSSCPQDKKWGRIIYIGRLSPHKNIEFAIDAYSLAKSELPDLEFHIVGDGSQYSLILELAGNVEDCHVHGSLTEDEMLELLGSSWLLIQPSEREGSGLVALEAMAAGTPVLTVDRPCNALKDLSPELVAVSPLEKWAFASAIRDVYMDEEDWNEISSKSRLFASFYDWDQITDTMEGYLKERLEGGPGYD